MVPAMLEDKYVIRFCVNSKNACEKDMIEAWSLIKNEADLLISQTEKENLNRKFEATNLIANTITPQMRRQRFGISKMVSDPRMYHQKKYKRSNTSVRFCDSGKYLARKCSIVEKSEEDEN
jgi:hypothetical protein